MTIFLDKTDEELAALEKRDRELEEYCEQLVDQVLRGIPVPKHDHLVRG